MKIKATTPAVPVVTIKLEFEEAYALYEGFTGEKTGMTDISSATIGEMLVAGLRAELGISTEVNLFEAAREEMQQQEQEAAPKMLEEATV